MRRLVDSLLFVLIAYTVTWPVVRGFTGAGGAADRTLLLELRGGPMAHAVVHVASDEESAVRRTFAGSFDADDQGAPDIVQGLGDRDRVWVVVQLADVSLPAYAIEVDRSTLPARVVVDLPFDAEQEAPDQQPARDAR